MTDKIDIGPLKAFARKELRKYPMTLTLISDEPEFMPREEFALKLKIWLCVLENEIVQNALR